MTELQEDPTNTNRKRKVLLALARTSVAETAARTGAKLGITRDEVLAAVRSRGSTVRRRPGSITSARQTRKALWRMATVVDFLAAAAPDVRDWYQNNSDAQAAMKIGDMNALLMAWLQHEIREGHVEPPYVPGHADVTIEPNSNNWTPVVSEDLDSTPVNWPTAR